MALCSAPEEQFGQSSGAPVATAPSLTFAAPTAVVQEPARLLPPLLACLLLLVCCWGAIRWKNCVPGFEPPKAWQDWTGKSPLHAELKLLAAGCLLLRVALRFAPAARIPARVDR